MYCNQCGKQLPDDAKFCHHCGSAVGIEENNKQPIEKPKKEIKLPKMKKDKQEHTEKKEKQEKKERPAVPFGKKKMIVLAVITLAVIAIIAVVVMAMTAQKVVGELPDPEYYFSNVEIDEMNENNDVKQVILRSDEDLWDEAAAYVNLLKWSGKYPVTQSDEARYSSGDYMWNFVHDNREDIKSPYFCQVEVNYYCKSNGRDVYAVWITIHDTDAFDLVEREVYEEPTQTETTPSGNFSGTGDSGNSSSSSTGSEKTPTTDNSSSTGSTFDDDDDDFEVHDAADIYDNPTPCGVCDRSGDCQTCDGDGYLMSSASDKEDRNCYACSGSGNCRSCGGDGEL